MMQNELVDAGTLRGKKVKMLASQARYPKGNQHQIFEWAVDGTLNGNVLTQAGTINFKVVRNTNCKHKMAWIRLDCSESGGANSVTPTVCPLFITTINVYRDMGKKIQRIDGENILFTLDSKPSDYLSTIAPVMNMDTTLSNPKPILAGKQRSYYIPLANLWCWNMALDSLISDIKIEVNTAPSVETGSGTLTVIGAQLVLHSEFIPQDSLSSRLWKEAELTNVFEKPYVDWLLFQPASQTFNGGQKYPFIMGGITGKVLFLQFFLRAGSNPTNVNGARRLLTSLGDTQADGQYQLLDSAGKTITGLAVESAVNRYLIASEDEKGQTTVSSPVYTIAVNDPSRALQGKFDNWIEMSGMHQLEITPAPAMSGNASEIVTLTPGLATAAGSAATLASGTWSISYGGNTTSILAFNASAAVVQAALQALPSIGTGNVTVALNSGVYTLTFAGLLANKPLASAGFSVSVNNFGLANATPVACVVVPAVSTAGVAPTAGSFTSGIYTLTVYAAVAKKIRVENGNVEDLLF